MTLPRHARIVIVGGGAVGCSIAYHLARSGERDVLVIEKSGLTHGSTWHAAGLVGQLRGKRNLTRLMADGVQLYRRLTKETGITVDWREVGSLRLASSEARFDEIKRSITTARSFGFECHLLSAREAGERFPLMDPEGVVGAAFIPSDGYIDPSGLTQAYVRGARAGAAIVREGVRVTGVTVKNRRATAVVTDQGTVGCEILVIAAGIWSRQVGAMAGVALAAGAVEHQYLVTEATLKFAHDLTTLRDPDNNFYLKPDVGAFAVGGWEANAPAFRPEGVPWDFGRELLASDFERFEAISGPASRRIPALNEVGIKSLINGPIPVSADGEPIMGLAPERDNVFVACGFTAGIAASGGAGRAMAAWILEGDPGMDLWAFDARRFGPHHAGPRLLAERSVESYGRYYALHTPGEEMTSGRGARRSPLYAKLAARGAVFGTRFGWERANLFAHPGEIGLEHGSYLEQPGWFDAQAREHAAVRENVAMIDQTSFAKFEVSGPGALAALQRLAANDLDVAPGRAVYTQLLNPRGGIESDLTITRTHEDRFYVVTGSGFGVRDGGWIRRHLAPDGQACLAEVTSAMAVINLAGPRSRAVLAIRITYLGELGWELHMAAEHAPHVYERLAEAGRVFTIADVGYRAIESLRMEKRYLYWGADVGPETTPDEAGLGAFVKPDKGEFIGREAVLAAREAGPGRILCGFALDGWAPIIGGEAIVRGGRVLGLVTSGAYGYTVGRTLALGYLPVEEAGHRDYEIEAFCERFPAERFEGAAYDPERRRILA
jgi:sarcosine dehydrogenase